MKKLIKRGGQMIPKNILVKVENGLLNWCQKKNYRADHEVFNLEDWSCRCVINSIGTKLTYDQTIVAVTEYFQNPKKRYSCLIICECHVGKSIVAIWRADKHVIKISGKFPVRGCCWKVESFKCEKDLYELKEENIAKTEIGC